LQSKKKKAFKSKKQKKSKKGYKKDSKKDKKKDSKKVSKKGSKKDKYYKQGKGRTGQWKPLGGARGAYRNYGFESSRFSNTWDGENLRGWEFTPGGNRFLEFEDQAEYEEEDELEYEYEYEYEYEDEDEDEEEELWADRELLGFRIDSFDERDVDERYTQ
jgi:hypothetical protein